MGDGIPIHSPHTRLSPGYQLLTMTKNSGFYTEQHSAVPAVTMSRYVDTVGAVQHIITLLIQLLDMMMIALLAVLTQLWRQFSLICSFAHCK